MAQTLTLEQIYAMVEENAYLVADRKRNLVCIFKSEKEIYEPTGEEIDGEARITHLFRKITETEFEEVDYQGLRKNMREFFEEKMNISDLAGEVVDTTPPGILLDVSERIKNPEVRKQARAKKGCYAFVIPALDPTLQGKEGKPIEIYVR